MADFLRNWIINITIIAIFIMFLDTVMPNNSIKRYINVIVGLLIIIVVIKPFVLIKDYAEDFNSEFLETASYLEQSGSMGNSKEISKFQNKMALEIFEDNLKSQIIKVVRNSTKSKYIEVSAVLELDREFESKNFGEIKSVTVNLSKGRKEVIEVDRIRIGINEDMVENKNVINEDKAEYNLNDSNIKSEIKDKVSEALGISESIVSVNIQQY